MKLKFSILLFLIIALGLSLYGYFKAVPGAKKEKPKPKIEFRPKKYDFGLADYGQVLKYSFRVRNKGTKVLKISKVATSCACTSASIEQRRIAPGEVTDLNVVYETAKMSGSHGKGHQERIIYVKSNDPINPQSEVMVYADVE